MVVGGRAMERGFQLSFEAFSGHFFLKQFTRFLPVFTLYFPACRPMRPHVSHDRFKMDSVKEASMSKRRKNAALPEVLWIVAYIDNMTPSDSFDGEEMPREQAEARYAELTENGTRKTTKDKSVLGYYQLRQQKKAK